MLSIFSIPRAFDGHAGVIQRNAIRSWTLLHPDVEVILCGDDDGTEDASREFETRWVPDLRRSEFGTPYVDSAFARARALARHPLLAFVNADIMLTPALIGAVRLLNGTACLTVGSRTNLDLRSPWEFEGSDWHERLTARALRDGDPAEHWWIDYFIFPRDSALGDLPQLIVGRPGWDNYVIWRALDLGMPVVDASACVLAVHQTHDYAHVQGVRSESVGFGPEGDLNAAVIGRRKCGLLDATHLLTEDGMRRAWTRRHLVWRWCTKPYRRARRPLVNGLRRLVRRAPVRRAE